MFSANAMISKATPNPTASAAHFARLVIYWIRRLVHFSSIVLASINNIFENRNSFQRVVPNVPSKQQYHANGDKERAV